MESFNYRFAFQYDINIRNTFVTMCEYDDETWETRNCPDVFCNLPAMDVTVIDTDEENYEDIEDPLPTSSMDMAFLLKQNPFFFLQPDDDEDINVYKKQ